jgi:hypothetical protein
VCGEHVAVNQLCFKLLSGVAGFSQPRANVFKYFSSPMIEEVILVSIMIFDAMKDVNKSPHLILVINYNTVQTGACYHTYQYGSYCLIRIMTLI